jgi:hypothetical protein
MTRDDLLRHLDALCDGTLAPEEHAALERALSEDPEARRLYFDVLDTQIAMGRAAAWTGSRRKRRPRLLAAAAAVAAALLVAVGVFVSIRPRPAAVVAQSAAARFYGEAPAPGTPLRADRDYALTSGRVELAFASGAQAVVEGPAVFEVRDALHLRLKYGRCSVRIRPGAEGFELETPLTRIVDRGTRFSVDVEEGGETEVQMLEGRAEILAPGTPMAVLEEGRGRRIGAGSARDVPFDRGRALEMPDRVVRFRATDSGRGAELLRDVTVRRGGREHTYAVPDLIGVRLVAFASPFAKSNLTATRKGMPDPGPGRRAALLEEDLDLNTGVINPGGSETPLTRDPVVNDPEDPLRPNTPGLGLRFRSPVRNDAGPDVVCFEFQPVIQPEHGDPFHVSPLRFAPGLRSLTVSRWDLGIYSPEAPVGAGFRLNSFGSSSSRSSLEAAACRGGSDFNVTSKILAVGIDLSDLGYPPGAAVEGIFLQDVLDDGNRIDLTYVAGLPPIGEAR